MTIFNSILKSTTNIISVGVVGKASTAIRDFIKNEDGAISATAWIVGSASTFAGITAAVGGSAVLAGLAVAAVSIGISIVTSYALAALMPKPKVSTALSSGLLQNLKDPAAPHQIIYGKVRVGGTVTYIESTQNTKYLHQIICLAGHPCNSIGDIYLNDKIATVDTNGFVTTDAAGNNWNSKVRIKKFDGTQTAPSSDLLAETENSAIDSNFVGYGITYLYVRYEYDQSVFSNGLPLITAIVEGRKLNDPRTATTTYSSNAALAVRDYLESSYGLSAAPSEIDDGYFTASANDADTSVTLAAGGTEVKYSLNGVFNTDQTPQKILTDMTSAAGGTLFWGQGQWRYKTGYYTSPVKDFGYDDLRSNITVDTRQSRQSNFNGVKGTFNDASQNYITVDFPAITSSVFLAQDNGLASNLDLTLPCTTSAATAQRLAKQTLYRNREQMVVTADFGLSAFEVEVGDIISLTLDRYGWSAKPFEVQDWNFVYDKSLELKVSLKLRETSSAAFSWSAEESTLVANNTTLPNGFYVPDVTTTISADSSLGLVTITVNPVSDTWYWTEVQYKKSSDSVWNSLGTSANNVFTLHGLSDTNYDIRARAINKVGFVGNWDTTTNYAMSLAVKTDQIGPAQVVTSSVASNAISISGSASAPYASIGTGGTITVCSVTLSPSIATNVAIWVAGTASGSSASAQCTFLVVVNGSVVASYVVDEGSSEVGFTAHLTTNLVVGANTIELKAHDTGAAGGQAKGDFIAIALLR